MARPHERVSYMQLLDIRNGHLGTDDKVLFCVEASIEPSQQMVYALRSTQIRALSGTTVPHSHIFLSRVNGYSYL